MEPVSINQQKKTGSSSGGQHSGKKKKSKSNVCYSCGGVGHFVKDCLSPRENLNSQWEKRSQNPHCKKEASTSTMDQSQEEGTVDQMDGQEQG